MFCSKPKRAAIDNAIKFHLQPTKSYTEFLCVPFQHKGQCENCVTMGLVQNGIFDQSAIYMTVFVCIYWQYCTTRIHKDHLLISGAARSVVYFSYSVQSSVFITAFVCIYWHYCTTRIHKDHLLISGEARSVVYFSYSIQSSVFITALFICNFFPLEKKSLKVSPMALFRTVLCLKGERNCLILGINLFNLFNSTSDSNPLTTN